MEINCCDQGILIKGQRFEIVFDHPPKINQVSLAGAGEYEVGGVFIQGHSSGLYLFKIEDLRLVYFQVGAKDSKNFLDSLSEVDILVLDGRGEGVDLAKIVSEINRLDPRLIVPFHFTNIESLVKAEGVSQLKTDKFKIKKGDLAEEERKLLVLPCSIKSS